jgi:dTDP-4-amino-4,6-dideoxygalactose transaminase
MMPENPITVTKPHLPPLAEFIPYLEDIWASGWLTNGGQMHQRLELELAQYLGVPYVCLFNNATIALLVALQALDVKGEVITTPFSFVATSHSLKWHGNDPVFVDIDPVTLNMEPTKIEAAITDRTAAIMPVHCYGTPCDVDAIDGIAKRHGLKVIYDAAHAFGVRCHCGSVLNHGDLSILSFHATKVFNTFEGGAIICKDVAMKRRIDSLKNFGIQDEITVTDIGINGKMAEINAAFGLLQLKTIDAAITKRKAIAELYQELLAGVPGVRYVQKDIDAQLNYGYFPVLIEDGYRMSRDELYELLRSENILARRYFYPALSNLPMYSSIPSACVENLQVSNRASTSILCLPIFSELTHDEVIKISNLVKGV